MCRIVYSRVPITFSPSDGCRWMSAGGRRFLGSESIDVSLGFVDS